MHAEAEASSSDEEEVVQSAEAVGSAAGSKKKRKRKKKKKGAELVGVPGPTSTVTPPSTIGEAAEKHTEAAKPSKHFAKVPQHEKRAVQTPLAAAVKATPAAAATAMAASNSSTAIAVPRDQEQATATQSTTAAAAAATMQSTTMQGKQKKSVVNGSYTAYYEGRQAGGRGGVGSADPRLQLLQEHWFKDRRYMHYRQLLAACIAEQLLDKLAHSFCTALTLLHTNCSSVLHAYLQQNGYQ
jgi:hypothetical protein